MSDLFRIPLTQGQVALVDAPDYEMLARHKWCAVWNARAGFFYAARTTWKAEDPARKRRFLFMHREIMQPPPGMHVDHRDHDGLNNTRANLRLVTRSQNQANRRPQRGSSRFKGVHWRKSQRRWVAQIQVGGVRRVVRLSTDEEAAARAYDAAAREAFGEFAAVNFPGEGQ